jgi:hypothetical protein
MRKTPMKEIVKHAIDLQTNGTPIGGGRSKLSQKRDTDSSKLLNDVKKNF